LLWLNATVPTPPSPWKYAGLAPKHVTARLRVDHLEHFDPSVAWWVVGHDAKTLLRILRHRVPGLDVGAIVWTVG
jgi:hypothetical protein